MELNKGLINLFLIVGCDLKKKTKTFFCNKHSFLMGFINFEIYLPFVLRKQNMMYFRGVA